MTDVARKEKVDDLVGRFKSLWAGGKLSDATEALREASSLDPDNADVQAGWESLNASAAKGDVLDLVKAYLDAPDEDRGLRALGAVAQADSLAPKDGRRILTLCLDADDKLPFKRRLVAALFTLPATSKSLTETILERPTEIFKAVWASGSDALRALTNTTLAPTAWVSEKDRHKAERDIFMLLLAKLLEPGLDNPELAMGAIARMLSGDVGRFKDIIDSDSFDIMLSALSIDNDVVLRSQATLAVAKILEADPPGGQKLLTEGVIQRVTLQGTEDLIIAFSAAAAIFPVVPAIAAALFLTEGFLSDLNRLGANAGSLTLRRAALELLSAACVDKACRQAISEQSSEWLESQAKGRSGRLSTLAALILAKTSASPENPKRRPSLTPSEEGGDGLVAIFKDTLTDSDATVAETAIEGLAYRSTSPIVKEELANDSSFLARLVQTLNATAASTSPVVFGGLTILSNLTEYPPVLSAEQKRMAQLKAYANQSKPAGLDPLEEDARVTDRCSKVLDAGVASVLVKFVRKASPALFSLISSIIASIAKHPRHRGKMAQQGLFDAALRLASSDSITTAIPQVKRDASLALAQMLIKLNPALLFYNTAVNRPIPVAVSALSFLLTPAEVGGGSGTVNYFPVCEALKALTNMAAMSSEVADDAAIRAILAECWDTVEGYVESDVSQVRQAATECVCNLCISQQTTDLYTVDSKGSQRMAVLLRQGMFDPDRGTRLAAGGALAAILGAGGVGNFVKIKGSTGLLRKTLMMAKEEWAEKQAADELMRVLAILHAVLSDPSSGQAVRGQLNSWSSSEDDAPGRPGGGDVVGILKDLESSSVGQQAKECLGLFRNTGKSSS
ncbi:hypothetical protein FH972_022362 [Carpinus fangiana]|uniref:UNC-45/Cro1/She4 central domain-containing protein n=1 Tax=Carpinus fangiana TaxID=176857 RepID=A0A5N6KS19_9ROSI|nr:hypothetical protein FH972_022362 [Carpinus fangiana]